MLRRARAMTAGRISLSDYLVGLPLLPCRPSPVVGGAASGSASTRLGLRRMDSVMAGRLNEQFRREKRSNDAWKEKYGRREDFLYPNDPVKAQNLRALKALAEKSARASFASMDERIKAIEQLRVLMAQCAVDSDDASL